MRVLYFAWLRERIGRSSDDLSPPDSVTTPRELAAWLSTQEARYAAAFADLDPIQVALDQVQADLDAPIGAAREVAFFPPVTGG